MSSFYTVDQIASLLEMHPKTIRRYIRQGRLPARKIGKQYRIHGRDLNDFVGSRAPLDAPEKRQQLGLSDDKSPEPFSSPPSIHVSTTVEIENVSGARAADLTRRIMATINGAQQARTDCIYYEGTQRFKILLHGSMEYTELMLKHINMLITRAMAAVG